MSHSHQTIGLRPMLPNDVPVLAAIFAAAIEELTSDDYSEDQQSAWMAAADDEAAFGARLAPQLTLVATYDGAVVGFASLKGVDTLDTLFVLPSSARRGVATALCDALEKLAQARGAKAIETEASDTAQLFFAQRGYVPTQRNSRSLNGEWLANTTMRKPLAEDAS